MRNSIFAVIAALTISFEGAANAAVQTFDVDAEAHSIKFTESPIGAGLNTGIHVNAGDALMISVDPADLWSLGGGVEHNADGTLAFGALTFSAQTFAGGLLVGQIGDGDYFEIGTFFNGTANLSGLLSLFFWDTNSGDNSGFVTASVTYTPVVGEVPLPGALIFMGTALAGLSALRRRSLPI